MEKVRKVREKVGKSRNGETLCCSNVLCIRRVEKYRLAKAAGAEPAGSMRDGKVARRCGVKHICKSKV